MRTLPSVLAEQLRARIENDGPMPFEEFMDTCLYDPDGGFFTSGPLRSTKEGDFLTSPEVSPWFGRILARFVESQVAGRNSRAPFLVVDVGAGSGSLLDPLAAEIVARSVQLEAHAVEASPAARDALAARFGADRVHESLGELPDRFDGVVIANELLDNLPVALAVRTGEGWTERWVTAEGDAFALVEAPARPEVAAWCDAYGGKVAEGALVEAQLAATDWVGDALTRIDHGALLVIDYGGTAEELEPRRTQGTLRTYQRHHLGPDPLLEPGATDITVDVNFTAMTAAADQAGATVTLHRQDDFLRSLGLDDVVDGLRRRELDLARGDDAMARLSVRSEAIDAKTLLHPRGLGDFRVFVARRGNSGRFG